MNDILQKHEKIDILINNASVMTSGELVDCDPEEIENVIKVNMIGTLNATKAIVPHMKENREGLIININSQAGLYYKSERSAYHGSKWGVTGMTGSLQAELSKYGIRVTGVYPGALEISMEINKTKTPRAQNDGLKYSEVIRVIRFIMDTPKDVIIPEIGIKHINN